MKKLLRSPIFWITIISLLPLWALFVPGLPITHDGQDHVARIANFYQSLSEGNLAPRWAANLNWGYGHPILMFLYPLPSYIASFFHWIGFSLVDSTKLVFALSFIASALTMYLWMKNAFGKKAAIVGSLLYSFAPYRFVDLYVRGALGEDVAFIFPPLVCYFLYRLSIQEKTPKSVAYNMMGLAVSVAMLILSHNAMAIMFLPIIVLYLLYLVFIEVEHKGRFLLYCLTSIAWGLTLSAFFWIPAFFEGKYTLRDVVTLGQIKEFVPWTWFFYSPWNYGIGETLTKSLGFSQWLGIAASCLAIWKIREKKIRVVLIASFVILLSSLFIMMPASKLIWEKITLLQKFQFPWRFLSVSVFIVAVLGGIGISRMVSRLRTAHRNTLIIIYCLFLIVVTVPMWHPKGYQLRDEQFYSGIYDWTTDTGESSPIWSVRFMEHRPSTYLKVIDGDADITVVNRNTTVHEYSVMARKSTLVIENTVYFPGWTVLIDGTAVPIQYQNQNYRGLMLFQVPQGTHVVRVAFGDTKLRQFSDLISIVALGMLAAVGLGNKVWGKK